MSNTSPISFQGLNDVQIGLLRMFSRPMTIEQTMNLKRSIVNYLSNELEKEIEKVVAERGITDTDYEALKHQHQRTPNK